MRKFVPVLARERPDPLWQRLTAYSILCFFGTGGMAGAGFVAYIVLYSNRLVGGYIQDLPIAQQDSLFLAFVTTGAAVGFLAALGYGVFAEREYRQRARRK